MLLPENIHPQNSLYFNGAYILKALKKENDLSMIELYFRVKGFHQISMPVFVLTLDWLYLVGLVSFNSVGNITLCS